MMYRHGDVILVPVEVEVSGERLDHLTLAEGEATGHSHRIVGNAALFNTDAEDTAFMLQVYHEKAQLLHEEHGEIEIPEGLYEVKIQREYTPEAVRNVTD